MSGLGFAPEPGQVTSRPLAGYSNGNWITGTQAQFSNPLPADSSRNGGSFGIATDLDLEATLEAATAAQREWAALTPLARRHYLERAADELRRNASAIARLIVDEVGKCADEATAEVAGAAELLDTFAAWSKWGHHGSINSGNKRGIGQVSLKSPRGVVALITPWNFPASNVCQKAGAALIAGNAVIWRPSPVSPGVALAVTAAFDAAGLPPGVFNTLIEDSAELSQKLVQSNAISAVSFTGSTAVGLSIAGTASRRGAAVQCEMGGKNAAVVLQDADLDLAADRIAVGAFAYAGQKCTAISRLFVERAVADQFMPRLQLAISKLRVGMPDDPGTKVGPVISAAQVDRLQSAVQAACVRGAVVLSGGHPSAGELPEGAFFAPTLVQVSDSDEPLMQEELFGPVLTVAIVKHLSDAVRAVNNSEYGLASALFTNNLTATQTFIDSVRTGIVKINEAPPGLSPYSPACGWGNSSYGVGELAEEGIDFFTHKKTVYFPN